ncbi:MAG: antitoxin, RHH family protein [Candidatus Omnitrophota bacterium]|nr:antitoxin, RHH family protein [Candidatus Omnitrophota bacterium]
MSTKQPRLSIALERPVFQSVKCLAARDGVSMSLKARDLIRAALELHEDAYWVERAHERAKTFVRSEALTHEQVWARLKKRRR